MFSDLFYQLWDKGEFLRATWETVYMTLLSTLVAYGIGLPLNIVLNVTSKGGLHPQRGLNAALGFLVNIFRSIPFIILMVAMLPVAKAIVGTSLGNKAMVVMLIIAAAPYVARMVESALQEVKPGVIEAAQAMGASDGVIIWKLLSRRPNPRSSPARSSRPLPFSATPPWPVRSPAAASARSPSITATSAPRTTSSGSAWC